MPSWHTHDVSRAEASYEISAKVWLWQGDSPWHFVTIPADIADEIRDRVAGHMRRGFGSVRVEVSGGSPRYTWQTSVFPDKKSGGYLLPLKREAREALQCDVGDTLTLTVRLRG